MMSTYTIISTYPNYLIDVHIHSLVCALHFVCLFQFQFTDGASSQFKSREPFMDVSSCMIDHGIVIERTGVFLSYHGKGPCDGVGGIVKAAARQAVLAGEVRL